MREPVFSQAVRVQRCVCVLQSDVSDRTNIRHECAVQMRQISCAELTQLQFDSGCQVSHHKSQAMVAGVWRGSGVVGAGLVRVGSLYFNCKSLPVGM